MGLLDGDLVVDQGCQIQNLEISSLLLRNQKFIRRIYLQNQEKNQEVFL
jgi:hypothetical protein